MDTLFDQPVMDIIAGFIIVLVILFLLMTRIAWQQWKRANWLAAELNGRIIHRDADQQMRGMIAYIKIHPCTRREPDFPCDQFTLDWMENQNIKKVDAQAVIYKYLSKALRPNENH